MLCEAIPILFGLRYATTAGTDAESRDELARKTLYILDPAIQQYSTHTSSPPIPPKPSYIKDVQLVESVIAFEAPKPSNQGYLIWEHHHHSIMAVLFSLGATNTSWREAISLSSAITHTVPRLHLLLNHLLFESRWDSKHPFEGRTMYDRICEPLFSAWRAIFATECARDDTKLIDEAVIAGMLFCCEHVSYHRAVPKMLGKFPLLLSSTTECH